MGAYDWKRDYKVGQKYELRDGTIIEVIKVNTGGGMTAEIYGQYNVLGKPETDSWDSQGWYHDYWTPSEKDISGGPINEE
jgi:hypothetical protein